MFVLGTFRKTLVQLTCEIGKSSWICCVVSIFFILRKLIVTSENFVLANKFKNYKSKGIKEVLPLINGWTSFYYYYNIYYYDLKLIISQ